MSIRYYYLQGSDELAHRKGAAFPAEWFGRCRVKFRAGAGHGGRPDGAAADADGNYWVVMSEGARVLKLSPAGAVLAEIAVPAQCPTMPCLGGEDGRTLYLTTARYNRSAAELAAYPQSGCVFSARVDRSGLAPNFFQG